MCGALRSAILAYGVPEKFLRDNGREFTAGRLGGKAARLQSPGANDLRGRKRWPAAMPDEAERAGVWQALGVEVVTALPYSAWSKPIESYFGAFAAQWEHNVPGYTGRDAKDRPEVLEKHVAAGNVLTWAQFQQVFAEQVERWNREHVVGQRKHAPAWYYKDYSPSIPAPETLTFLLQDERELTVRTHGVEIDGRLYQSPALALHVGRKVRVRFDSAADEHVYVYTPEGQVLAVPKAPLATWAGFGEANLLAKRCAREQRALLAATREETDGALTIAERDPTGTFRMVADRKSKIAAGQAELARARKAARKQLDAEAEAADRAKAQRGGRRRTIYDDIIDRGLARARRETEAQGAADGRLRRRESRRVSDVTIYGVGLRRERGAAYLAGAGRHKPKVAAAYRVIAGLVDVCCEAAHEGLVAEADAELLGLTWARAWGHSVIFRRAVDLALEGDVPDGLRKDLGVLRFYGLLDEQADATGPERLPFDVFIEQLRGMDPANDKEALLSAALLDLADLLPRGKAAAGTWREGLPELRRIRSGLKGLTPADLADVDDVVVEFSTWLRLIPDAAALANREVA